jgi:hypothetical protein
MSGDLEVYLEYFSELCEQLQDSKSLDYEDMGRFVYAENAINERLKASSGATPGAFAEFIEKQRSLKNSWEKRDWELYNRLKNPESGGEVIMASVLDAGAKLSAQERSQGDALGSGRAPGSGRGQDGAVVDSIFGHVRTLEGIATSSLKDEVRSTTPPQAQFQPYVDSANNAANFTFAAIEPECATPGSRSARQLTARILEEGMSQFSMEEYHKAQDDRRLCALGLTPRGPRVSSLPLQEIPSQSVGKQNAKPGSSRRACSPACPVLDATATPVTPTMHGSHATQAVPVSTYPTTNATVVNATAVVAEPAPRSVPKVPDTVTATVVSTNSTKNSARGKCAVWLKGGGVERPSAGLRRSQSAISVVRSRSSLSEPEAEAEIREMQAPSSRAASPRRTQRGSKDIAQAPRFPQAQVSDLYQEIRALREEKNSEVEQLRAECRGLRMALQKTQGELQKAQGEIKELKEEASVKKIIRDKDVFFRRKTKNLWKRAWTPQGSQKLCERTCIACAL